MLIDERLCNGQSQACAFGVTRHHGEKNLIAYRFRYAGAVIDNVKLQHQSMMFVANGEMT